MQRSNMKRLWYVLIGSHYLWRVWPIRFIIRPIGYRFAGNLAVWLVWPVGYLPRIRLRKLYDNASAGGNNIVA